MRHHNLQVTGSVVVNGLGLATTADLTSYTASTDAKISTLQSFTASVSTTNTFTASASSRLNSIETITASNIARINAIEIITASNIARINSLESTSASVDSLNTTQNTRLNSLEIKTGSLATTGSNTFYGTQVFSGSLFVQDNLIVQGSSSLQNITASAVSIGTNTVLLNTANPSVRFGGISVVDSGSAAGKSGSLYFDSTDDEWIFVHAGNTAVTSSIMITGPETYNGVGTETRLTTNIIPKIQSGFHLYDSCIFDNGTTICAKTNFVGTGTIGGTTLCSSNGIVGNNSNNLYLSSNSSAGEISFWGNQLNTRLMTINGGGCVGIGVSTPCKSLHVYSGGNEVAYFQGTTTGAWIDIKSAASNTWSIGAADGCAFAIYNRTAGSTLMYIKNEGNVGVGTENPYSSAKFQVKTATNVNIAVQTGTTDTSGIKLNAFNDIGNTNIPLELNGNTLYFKTCETPRLTINGNGISCFSCQVYVGTNKFCWTDTTFKTLQVGNGAFNNINNQTQIVNNIYYDDANYRSLIGGASNRVIMTTAGNLFFEYACASTAGSILTLDPKFFICGINGNVGINSSTPKEALEISGLFGNIRIYGRSGISNNTISSNIYWDGANWVRDNGSYGAAYMTLSAQSGAIIFATTSNTSGDATERMRITSAGLVGIGTNNFGERLNIGCGGAIAWQNTSNCQKWHIQYRNVEDGLNFVESAVEDFRLFIKAGGNIGIGTKSPEYPLHIYRCAPLGMKIQTCGSNFGSPGINLLNGGVDTVLSATNNGLEIGTWSANDIIFKVTQVERLRINTAGIVTMPFQPSMFAQPGASSFTVGGSGSTAYGWCTSGSVRYNCGFTLTAATTAANNVADAGASGKIIIPATGKYLLQFSQRNEGQTTSDGQFYLWVNGSMKIRRHIELWNGKPYFHVDVTALLPLNSGDCLEMGAWFNTGGKTDTFSGTGDQVNWMSLAKIS